MIRLPVTCPRKYYYSSKRLFVSEMPIIRQFFFFLQKVIVNFLSNDGNDAQIKDEALREIPNLMITECVNQNWKFLISNLVEMMHTISPERHEKIIHLLAHFDGLL